MMASPIQNGKRVCLVFMCLKSVFIVFFFFAEVTRLILASKIIETLSKFNPFQAEKNYSFYHIIVQIKGVMAHVNLAFSSSIKGHSEVNIFYKNHSPCIFIPPPSPDPQSPNITTLHSF